MRIDYSLTIGSMMPSVIILSRLWCGTMDGGSVTIPNFPRIKGSLYSVHVVKSEYIVVVYVIYKSASMSRNSDRAHI